MLRKMYLVSDPNVLQQPPAPTPPTPQQLAAAMPKPRTMKSNNRKGRITKQKKQYPHDKWVTLKRKKGEADIARKTLLEKIADFLQ